MSKRAALVHGDVIGLVALDLVLRILFRSVAHISFVGDILAMHLDDLAAHAAGFGVPPDVAADPEFRRHVSHARQPAPLKRETPILSRHSLGKNTFLATLMMALFQRGNEFCK
jgi:hypothetical protein